MQYNICKQTKVLRHQRKIHAQEKQIICSQICGVCRDKFKTMFDLHDHIEKKHSEINLVFLEKEFYGEDDFNNWKRENFYIILKIMKIQ